MLTTTALGVFFSLATFSSAGHASGTAADQPVKGIIKVKKDLAEKVAPTDVLYIIARKTSELGGAPLAVLRITSPKFPYQFEIGAANVMMAGTPFKGPFTLTAKLSKKGDAMTNPGDLLGNAESKQRITNGTKNVQITLDKVAP